MFQAFLLGICQFVISIKWYDFDSYKEIKVPFFNVIL